MLSNLLLPGVTITENAAIAAVSWIGSGDSKAADQAAVDAMRSGLMQLDIDGTVVIGEGERDEAPMLYIGEKVGNGTIAIDIALDPLECTTVCANHGDNSLTVMALAPQGSFLHAPDVYMEKIAVGANIPSGKISLENSLKQNIKIVAQAQSKSISDITVCVLERPRHQNLIQQIRELGARVKLIPDGDIFAVIETAKINSAIDIYMGSGGAPEGVLAASALRTIGGDFQGRLVFRNDDERARATQAGITDFTKIYCLNDLAKGDHMTFFATAVTNGTLMPGIYHDQGKIIVHSLVIDLKTNTQRIICNRRL